MTILQNSATATDCLGKGPVSCLSQRMGKVRSKSASSFSLSPVSAERQPDCVQQHRQIHNKSAGSGGGTGSRGGSVAVLVVATVTGCRCQRITYEHMTVACFCGMKSQGF